MLGWSMWWRDLFEWWPTETYDFVFFGFWLSHVPMQQFNRVWEMVRAALKPGGRAFFVDGLATQESTARDHAEIDDSGVMERKLNDGQTFNIVKVFHDPDQLERQLRDLGWSGSVGSNRTILLLRLHGADSNWLTNASVEIISTKSQG